MVTVMFAALGAYWLWLGISYLSKPYLANEAFELFVCVVVLGAGCLGIAGRIFWNMGRSWVRMYPCYMEGRLIRGWLAKPKLIRTEYSNVKLPEAHMFSERLAAPVWIDGKRYIVVCRNPDDFRRSLRSRLGAALQVPADTAEL